MEEVNTCKYKWSDFKKNKPIAAFDFDGTLIKPFGKFANRLDDFIILIEEDFFHRIRDDYNIVIFTNQLKYRKITEMRILSVMEKLGIENVFVSLKRDEFRKPNIGMWKLMTSFIDYNLSREILEDSFYVGDAGGRPDDHSSDDIDFALNVGVDFVHIEDFLQSPFYKGEN